MKAWEFYNNLRASGVPATLIMVRNAEHGFRQVGATPINPSRSQITATMVTFFNTQLRGLTLTLREKTAPISITETQTGFLEPVMIVMVAGTLVLVLIISLKRFAHIDRKLTISILGQFLSITECNSRMSPHRIDSAKVY